MPWCGESSKVRAAEEAAAIAEVAAAWVKAGANDSPPVLPRPQYLPSPSGSAALPNCSACRCLTHKYHGTREVGCLELDEPLILPQSGAGAAHFTLQSDRDCRGTYHLRSILLLARSVRASCDPARAIRTHQTDTEYAVYRMYLSLCCCCKVAQIDAPFWTHR